MRSQLLALARRIALVINDAVSSRGAIGDDVAQRLAELLPLPRLWALSVVLASWELSRDERNRKALSALLSGAGVPKFWPQLDLFGAQLGPFVQAAKDAQTVEEQTEAAIRFLDVVRALGIGLIRQVVQSRAFRIATEAINRDFLLDGSTIPVTPKPPSKPPKKSAPMTDPPSGEALDALPWRVGGPLANREETATAYLIFLGWSRREVEIFLSGKR